jgi:drug/metabolite transporter (DMT)-like permease
MIELGFLLAYRQGWRLNRASLVSNVVVALLLVPVGAAVFREQVSLRMLVGVLLCVAGLLLLAGAPATP